MLKLSKLSDYAVVIVSNLDNHQDEALPASMVAHNTRLPEPTVAKILKLLGASDVVSSTRGVKGGYKLSKSLEDISIKDIINALDGPIALTACVEETGEGCDFATTCAMHGRWNQVNKAIKEALDAVSIADMISNQPKFTKKRA